MPFVLCIERSIIGGGVYILSEEKLNVIVSSYRTMVYRLAFSYTGNRHDAEDIAQNVFLKLYRTKNDSGDFNGPEHEKAFIIRMTMNESKNFLSSSWRKMRTELDEKTVYQGYSGEAENVVKDYVMRLKPKYRAVIYLYYYEGYSVRETARILKISESSVTTQLSRARLKLKETMVKEAVYE